MNVAVLSLFVALAAAGPAAAEDNPVLAELLSKGVAMPDGSALKLPAPTLPDGLDAAEQTAAITKLAAPNYTIEQFTQKYSSAPVALKVRTVRGEQGTVCRTIDFGFVAHGRWETLVSNKFADTIVNTKKKENSEKGRTVSKAGFLTEEETRKRELTPSVKKEGQEERFFYTTFTLFDLVEVSATRDAVLTKSPSSFVLAARVDPRFADDAEYPNQWRGVERNAVGDLVFKKKQPYGGAGFYIKVTRLALPKGTIFVEYHSVFHEPKGWFDGENLLRAKLPTIIQHEVRQFRGKFGKASLDETTEKP